MLEDSPYFSVVPAFRSAICFWIAIAHSTEENSSSTPSSIVLTSRPPNEPTIDVAPRAARAPPSR